MDHLEYANEDDVKLMSGAGSIAVILPGAYYTLNETQKPPINYLESIMCLWQLQQTVIQDHHLLHQFYLQ